MGGAVANTRARKSDSRPWPAADTNDVSFFNGRTRFNFT
jgi:hypothetical protein